MTKPASLLYAFRHPLVILSIGLLIFNDHVLKASVPSVWTGKLSDFAGLFFFPFLVGLCVQWLVCGKVPARRALGIGFALSTMIFTAIKTLPAVNMMAVSLLTQLFGLPVSIALDPSDLMAFVVFLPAWKVWEGIETGTTNKKPGKLAYLGLVVGSLAAMATAPCAPTPSIIRVAEVDDVLYVGGSFSYHHGDDLSEPAWISFSQDGGQTWQTAISKRNSAALEPVEEAGELAINPFTQPVVYPLTICNPSDAQSCYRVNGSDQIEKSQDGGQTWKSAWQIPPGRRDYMNRANGYGGCEKEPDTQVYELTFVERNGQQTLVAAMGNEGILIHPVDGGWERVAYRNRDAYYGNKIAPTRFYAGNASEVFADTFIELTILLFAGMWVWLGWVLWLRNKTHNTNSCILRLVMILSILLVEEAVRFCFESSFYFAVIAIYISPFIFLTQIVIALTAGREVSDPLKPLIKKAFQWGVAFFLGTWVWFVLWTIGIIPYYQLALALAATFGLGVLVTSTRWMRSKYQETEKRKMQLE